MTSFTHLTPHKKPPNATRWSLRMMAARVGIALSAVRKIWKAHPLLTRTSSGRSPHDRSSKKLAHANKH
jgi:hypothetical protein